MAQAKQSVCSLSPTSVHKCCTTSWGMLLKKGQQCLTSHAASSCTSDAERSKLLFGKTNNTVSASTIAAAVYCSPTLLSLAHHLCITFWREHCKQLPLLLPAQSSLFCGYGQSLTACFGIWPAVFLCQLRHSLLLQLVITHRHKQNKAIIRLRNCKFPAVRNTTYPSGGTCHSLNVEFDFC